jgi:proteic killer suppression protein
MIRSIRDRRIPIILAGGTPKGFPANLVRPTQRKLQMLDAAGAIGELNSPPGNRLEALKGDRRGQYSIRINDQWRLAFAWNDGAEDVEIVDYH